MTVPLDLNGPSIDQFEYWPDAWVELGLIQRFDIVATRYADRLAIEDGENRLTYERLAATVRQLAARIDAEAAPGAVGIIQAHSAAFWVAILACIGAGRTCVALDLHHPANRNAEILREAGLAAVIVPPQFDADCEVVPNEVPRFTWTLAEPARQTPEWPCRTLPAADETAMVLYTSGSTGRPKGIANSQQALLQRVAQYANACRLRAGDRMLTLSSPCTIAGMREGLTALLTGATLHVVDAQRHSLSDIARHIREARITVLNAVPSMLRSLMSAPDAGRTWRSVRVVRLGGEVVFWTDIALLRCVLPDTSHIQIGYSATEFTGTQWFVPRDAQPDGPFVPVGYVLPGNIASVVDDAGNPVSLGETGELVLRSRFIALGEWWNGRCIPGNMHPDPEWSGTRVLHTGDLARVDADGLCTVIGRKDRQVKINGMRVEPSEVEAVLRSLPGVADAAVLPRAADNVTTLAAFVVPRDGRWALTGNEIRASLRAALPPAMRPARLHMLTKMPRLPSAKLDMQALRRLDQEPDEAGARPPGPREIASDPITQAVRQSWRTVLGRHALDGDPSFEEAGGDSLRLLQFVLWLETLLDRSLPLELFTEEMHAAEAVGAVMQADRCRDADTPPDRTPTLHMFPGLGGDEPRLAQFRAGLKDRLRFVTITYLDWPEMVRRGRQFEVLVELAVSQITASRPSGALMLAGYSFGGDVAWAAALRLVTLGRSVLFLGILDSDLNYVAELAAAEQRGEIGWNGRQVLRETAYDRLHAGAGFALSKLLRDGLGLESALRYAPLWRPLLPKRTCFALDRRMRMILRLQARWQWSRSYEPALLDVPTVLFRSNAHAADAAPDLGWNARCSRLSVVPVAGNHHSMLDPPHRAILCDRFATAVCVG